MYNEEIVSEMTYTVSSGTLNSSIPYHTYNEEISKDPITPQMYRYTTLMDHEHGTVCKPILEHQIRLSAPSSVISRPTCFSSSLRCFWQVASAPFVRRRCDCLASSTPFTNIQTYLLTNLFLCGYIMCQLNYIVLSSHRDIFIGFSRQPYS